MNQDDLDMTDNAEMMPPVTHEQAHESARRLINSHFNHRKPFARVSIPANPKEDDDLIICRYIEEQEAEIKAQRESWVRGEMGMGSDADEASYRTTLTTRGQEQGK